VATKNILGHYKRVVFKLGRLWGWIGFGASTLQQISEPPYSPFVFSVCFWFCSIYPI